MFHLLFQQENSLDNFYKRLLKYLASIHDNSCAGLYYNNDGIYKLRMVAGDIKKIDELPGELDNKTTESWHNSIKQGEFFHSAGLYPSMASFMTIPPDVIFVHQGVRSDISEYMIALVLNGDISRQKINAIRQIAGIVANLEDSQFTRITEIIQYYDKLLTVDKNKDLDKILLDLFELLKKHMRISRLLIKESNNSCRVIYNKPNVTPLITFEQCDIIPDEFMKQLKRDNYCFIPELRKQVNDEAVAKRYYLANVKSEAYYQIKKNTLDNYIIAYGAPVEGKYLSELKPFLGQISKFICHLVSIKDGSMSYYINRYDNVEEKKLSLQRIETFRKLSSGYFHDVFEQISVIFGQTDVAEKAINNDDGYLSLDKLSSGINKIGMASEELALTLTNLKKLSSIDGKSISAPVSCRTFISQLPALLDGYLKQILDTKNIVIKLDVTALSVRDFNLPYNYFYDYLLPLLLALCDNTIKSSVYKITMDSSIRDNRIIIEYENHSTAIVNTFRLISNLFTTNESIIINDIIKLKEMDLTLNLVGNDRQAVHLIFPAEIIERKSVTSNITGSQKI